MKPLMSHDPVPEKPNASYDSVTQTGSRHFQQAIKMRRNYIYDVNENENQTN